MKSSINKSVFHHITSSPNYLQTKDITLIYSKYENSCLGFVVPKKLGKASKRNLFRRRCKNVFELVCKQDLSSKVGVIVKPQSLNITYNQISNIFNKLSHKLIEN